MKLGYDVFLGGGIGLVEESGADVLVVRKGKGKGHKGFGKRGLIEDSAARAALSLGLGVSESIHSQTYFLVGCTEGDDAYRGYHHVLGTISDQTARCAAFAQESGYDAFQLDGDGGCYTGTPIRVHRAVKCENASAVLAAYAS